MSQGAGLSMASFIKEILLITESRTRSIVAGFDSK